MINITIYNLSVKIETNEQNLIDKLNEFLDRYYTSKQSGFGKKNVVEYKPFYSKLKDYSIYYIHINQFLHFYNYLRKIGYKLNNVTRVDKRDYKVTEANITIRENWQLRDYQVPVVEFLLDKPTGSKLVPLKTGYGKTIISLWAMAQLKSRIGIVILPTFIDKFVEDILKTYEATPDEIMVIQGSKALRTLIELAKENNLDCNYFIFSNRTLQEYITTYEENPELALEMYGLEPIELFPLLGIGVLLVDETHMHFHSLFKILIHTNVKYHIGLTATLLSDDYVVRRMHKIVYPDNCIYSDVKDEKYVDIYAINYTISPNAIKLIKTTNYGSCAYSHIAFEQSILKRDFLIRGYIKIIKNVLETYYIEKYEEGDKCLIFVSTVQLASILTEELRKSYSSEHKVSRYCEDDPYENLIESDIIVSTNLSAGTGVDIPNLRVAIQTVSINSQVMNLQSLGRLRKLPGKDVRFCYIYSSNIAKQVEYHKKRIELFKERALTHSIVKSRYDLGY